MRPLVDIQQINIPQKLKVERFVNDYEYDSISVTSLYTSKIYESPHKSIKMLTFTNRLDIYLFESMILQLSSNEITKIKKDYGDFVRQIQRDFDIGSQGFLIIGELDIKGSFIEKIDNSLSIKLSNMNNRIIIPIINDLKVEVQSNKTFYLFGLNKQLVNNFFNNIRNKVQFNPYTGDSLRKKGEVVKKKLSKKVSSA